MIVPAAVATIRPGTPDDAEPLAALMRVTFPLACPDTTPAADIALHLRTTLSPAALRGDLADPLATVLLAETGPDLVGMAMLQRGEAPPVALPAARPVQLLRIYVERMRHGTGLAAQLLDRCVELAVAEHFDAIWLGTNQDNTRAIRFYQRQGFTIAGTKTFTVGTNLEHDYVLTRPLP